VPRTLSNADKRRLLVVDDDPSELKGVARILKPHTHSVECRFLEKGIDALVHVGLFKPHAVLLDVFMPGLDGIEVCRRLNAMEETRDVNLVVVSARMTSELEAQAKEAGAIRCYQKPVPVPDLLELLGLEELRESG
jgi:CheY-like chemotaxis protein